MTPTQKYLESLNACVEARAWVRDRELKHAWNECTRLDWMRWLVTAPAQAEYDRVTAAAWVEYDRVTAAARDEYKRVAAAAQACKSCDELRSEFECPEVTK